MTRSGLLLAAIVALAVVPFVASNYLLYLLNLIAINMILAIGLDILTGWTGQISLGHAGFTAIGAYASGLAVVDLGIPFWLAMPLAALFCAAVSVIIGAPALRLSGHYLALATFGFGEVIQLIIIHSASLTNGSKGLTIPAPVIAGFKLDSDRSLYFLIIPVTALLMWLAWNLSRSAMGRALLSIRMSELGASSVGINLPRYKTLAFALSAFYAGIAGGLFGGMVKFIDPGAFSVWNSILYLTMIAVGGMRSIPGAVIGATLLTLLPELLSGLQQYMELAYGVLLLTFIIFIPEGIYGRVQSWRAAVFGSAVPARPSRDSGAGLEH